MHYLLLDAPQFNILIRKKTKETFRINSDVRKIWLYLPTDEQQIARAYGVYFVFQTILRK